jgi:hypothetical protein
MERLAGPITGRPQPEAAGYGQKVSEKEGPGRRRRFARFQRDFQVLEVGFSVVVGK